MVHAGIVLIVVFVLIPIPVRAATTTFTVTSSADPGDGRCNDTCTLREAIKAANAHAGADIIEFALPGPGPYSISLAPPGAGGGPLPPISDPLLISGRSQPDANAVEINGANAGASAVGLTVLAGPSTISGFVINRFAGDGLMISGGSGIRVYENSIGTTTTGTSDLGNGGSGVRVDPSSPNVTIGSPIIESNVISGNRESGVYVVGVEGVHVVDNEIGTDVMGSLDLGNSGDGITIDNSSRTTVRGNVIAGNDQSGIRVVGAGSKDNVVQDNVIGSRPSRHWSPFGNGGDGITIADGASRNTIGALVADERQYASRDDLGGNVIGLNGDDGVEILSGAHNVVRANEVVANDGLGIDLAPDGVNANDAGDIDDGPNGLQNAPVLDVHQSAGGSFPSVAGSLEAAPNTKYDIDFFRNPGCDPSGSGEGAQWIASIVVTTDSSGHSSFLLGFWYAEDDQTLALSRGEGVTATATNLVTGDTSEFSPCAGIKQSDMSVAMTASPTRVTVGAQVTYSIEFHNPGPDPAERAEVGIGLPMGSQLVSMTTSSGDGCDRRTEVTIWCRFGSIDAGDSATATVAIRPQAPGRQTASASLASFTYDDSLEDNVAFSTVDVECTETGTAGADVLQGSAGDDVICGAGGSDTLVGLGGNDLLLGGSGNDQIEGGKGFDVVSSARSPQRVVASLYKRRSVGWGTDTFTGVEGLVGSSYSDTLIGNAARNVLKGLQSNDRLYGRRGNDRAFLLDKWRDSFSGGFGTDSARVDRNRDALSSVEITF